MKIVIKNPAPLGQNQEKWGDFHFGRCLSKYLERLGVKVETHFYQEWDQPTKADVVLVLRGKHRYHPQSGNVHILWCMSNPSTITTRECNTYNAVCVASATHAKNLRKTVSVPIYTLLQCTDPEQFEPFNNNNNRKAFIFVGNSRGVKRSCVDWAIEFGLALQLYGRGWKDWNLQHLVVADYIPNEELPELYGNSRLSLNDHWQDMKGLGYINNRIFDCLAAGLPVLSDDFPELREICGDALLYYSDQAGFNAAVTTALLSYPSVLKRQHDLWQNLRRDFSFEQRAKFLYELARDLQKSPARRKRDEPSVLKQPNDAFSVSQLQHIEVQRQQFVDGHYCPLCGSRSELFLDGGAHQKRKNAKCPECGALERHRLFWFYFVNNLWPRLPDGLKQLLHIAPEKHIGTLLHQKDDINYLSGDLMMTDVMVKLDLTNLDFPDDRFHLIVCSHVLEHIADDRKAIAEMYRVTKPGGFTLIQVPLYGKTTYENPEITTPEERVIHFGQKDHVRKYGEDITERLAEAGFEVHARRPFSELAPPTSKFLALHDQLIFECRKHPD